ncbi:MAG TPA: cysteine--tRNA ligase [Actinomycetota bacterium]|nr:cysteine--tRNA ligase [Actinomycetota bacterium]
MALMVTNTLTRRKEQFVPRDEGRVAMYVCGPTVYGDIHVGNARAAVVFDVIRRYLSWRGFEVTFVQNYTDVDDKIINRANEEGRDWHQLARYYSEAYEAVAQALGLTPPDRLVKATDHIPDMIDMISRLVERGVAYEAAGSVWFSVEDFPGYGKLSGRTLDEVHARERVEPDPNKRKPLDFALWKAAKPGEPSWDSPWGPGRPGWHIECSAMSAKYLGMGFDIHGGGSDLVFPHHENEIAQAEAALGTEPFVRYWLHNGMVKMDAQKMSKSLGNLVLVKDILNEVRPEVLRMMSISGTYRSDVDFGEASLEQARRTVERFDNFARAASAPAEKVSDEGQEYLDRFADAMDDDFNTPLAISVMFDLVKQGNSLLDDPDAAERVAGLVAAFRQMTDILGVTWQGAPESGAAGGESLSPEEAELLERRAEARKSKNWTESDRLRDRLSELGIVVEDTPSGTRWHRSA